MKKKVLFIIPRLSIGGAQKVVSILLKHLDRNRFDLVLCVLEEQGEYMASLSADVQIISLQVKRVSKAFFKLLKVIKDTRPDVVFSALSHINLMVALYIPLVSKDIRFIARETNIPSLNNRQNKFTWLFHVLHRWLYPRYTKIVCQSRDMQNDLIENYAIPEDRLCIINNPVESDRNRLLAQNSERLFDTAKINLVAAGKLKYQKGFDLLLNAIAELNDEHFHLTILGKGELQETLQKQAEALDIARQVNFAGEVENPFPYLHQADVFILSSRFEGFPNIVLEALSVGTSVIAFDCKGGINEIVIDGINGILVKNGDSSALCQAIADCQRCLTLPDIAASVARFDVAVIVEQYNQLLDGMFSDQNNSICAEESFPSPSGRGLG